MEKIVFRTDLDSQTTVTSDWRKSLPVLVGNMVTLRELEVTDAPSLFAMLTAEEVTRFISPPPTTIEGFERFVLWARAERAAGRYACYAVVPHGMDTAVGLFQVRQLEADFSIAEWGFAMGSPFWGTGMFVDGSEQILAFIFDVLGVRRLEARAAIANGRGNGALRKLGAVQEGVLRRSFLKNGQLLDQIMWSMLAEDWKAKPVFASGLVH